MAEEKEKKKSVCRPETKAAILLGATSALMLIVSMFIPPRGIIDSSVIAAVGEIFAFAALFKAGEAIDRGIDAKITTAQGTKVEFNNPDNPNKPEEE